MGKWIWDDFATPSIIQVIKGFSTFFRHGGEGAFVIFLLLGGISFISMFWGISVIFYVLGVYQSFSGCGVCFGHFLSFQGHFGHLSDL